MQFAIVIAAALLGAVPAFAKQAAWCVGGADAGQVQKGCTDNGLALARDAGTCCLSTADDYEKMTKVCFYLGAKPTYGGDCGL
ncbi:hypothetical protein CKM354_000432700 [Cercospora kikuchii]|uniref:Uncharacterized protein n=1 Tax=Cercospora kikuchii TaxID=84275 RepID=A0A9P3FFN5_9PEZI|nr:uncharacterized protein CKM354_000432700 [Cercospora kikuchii]GIZ41009.1 hypothetical protein CKM354_000432700 [Cercospora kikuchii]